MDSQEPEKKRVLTLKNVINLLRPNTYQERIKSVLSPSAQITNKCEATDQFHSIIQAFEICQERLKVENIVLYYFVRLQFENALRVSEVINIKPSDIDSLGNILIHGLKGSSNKIIVAGDSKAYMLQCRELRVSPFADYNRFFIYRLYKKYNIMLLLDNRNKFSVTHTGRHISAIAARNEGFEEKTLSSHLNHKSLNSTKHYGK